MKSRTSLLLCVAIAALFVLAEVTMRLALFGPPAILQAGQYHPLERDLTEGVASRRIRYKLKPGLRTINKGLSFTTNSAGFRGPEIAREKPAGVFRIAVLGNSSCMGSGVADDEVYSHRLESRFDRESPGTVEVLNLAVAGYSLPQMLASYEAFARPYRPDAVIVPLYSTYSRVIEPVRRRRKAGPFELRPRLEASFAYQAARNTLAWRLESDWSARVRGRATPAAGDFDPTVSLRPFLVSRREEDVSVWLMPMPWPHEPGIAETQRRAAQVATGLGNVRVIDLPGALRREGRRLDRVFYGDAHIGPVGHDAIAAAIFEEVAGEVRQRRAEHAASAVAGALSPGT